MEYELTTSIVGVTVYSDRALVTRRGGVALEEPGTHAVRIGSLPLTVQRDSLRATGRGPAGTRILGVEQAEEFHAAAPEETLRRLRDEIIRLEREIAALDERGKVFEEQQNWLRSLAEQASRSLAWAMVRGTARTEDATQFFTYASEESQRVAMARLEVQRQREETQETLEAHRREYAQAGGARRPDRLTANVRVEVIAPGTVEIELSYLVQGAGWRPRYDARVDATAARVRLAQQALVTQRTGEDWARVALALSTARPSAAVRLPDDPEPWYIDTVRPVPPPPVRTPAPRMMASIARMAGAAPAEGGGLAEAGLEYEPLEVAELAAADIERSGAAQVFRMPGGVDVPSDGSPHLLGIGEHELPCQMDVVAVPVIADGAHLRATARNRTGQMLLAGELHVFHAGAAGDEYVGATRLDQTPEGADLVLYLGVDDTVTVKRELIERDTEKGNLLQAGVRRVTYGYRVTLSNRTDEPRHVVLKDRLPVPRHERVKLRVLDIKPQPDTRTKLEQLTWELQLSPGEERRMEWRFVIEAPADLELTGLP